MFVIWEVHEYIRLANNIMKCGTKFFIYRPYLPIWILHYVSFVTTRQGYYKPSIKFSVLPINHNIHLYTRFLSIFSINHAINYIW